MKKNEKFYELIRSENKNELLVYGDITSIKFCEEDVTAYDLASELSAVVGNLSVRINSYGGEVGQGIAMFNLLEDYQSDVNTICDGFACSIAATIFMAGSKRSMHKESLLFFHKAWSGVVGNSDDMRKTAEDLDRMTNLTKQILLRKTNMNEKSVDDLINGDTWINAQEALECGIATEIIGEPIKQALNDGIIYNLVNRNKELESKTKALEKQNEELRSNQPKDAWTSFFEGGK